MAATETEDGHAAYYVCEICGKYYADADGILEITLADIVIPATGKTDSSDNNGETGNSGSTDNSGSAGNTDGTGSADTGDSTMILPMFLMMAVSAGAVLVVWRKRRAR